MQLLAALVLHAGHAADARLAASLAEQLAGERSRAAERAKAEERSRAEEHSRLGGQLERLQEAVARRNRTAEVRLGGLQTGAHRQYRIPSCVPAG